MRSSFAPDEIKRLVSHRPRNVERFTMRWIIDGARISFALPTGVENHLPSEAWRLIDPGTRWFWEGLVGSGLCFGPHEITHVLTWQSWHMAWANEGFATLTDWLYQSASWRCCTAAIQLAHECDETATATGRRTTPTPISGAFRSRARCTTRLPASGAKSCGEAGSPRFDGS